MIRKYNRGIAGLLNIHTPRVEVVKKTKPSVQEMLDNEDLMNIYDPYWWKPDPLETPKPKPTDKFGNTKEQKDKMVNAYLTRPPDNNKEILKAKPKSTPILTYVDKMSVLYGGQEKRKYDDEGYPLEATLDQMKALEKRLDNSRQMTTYKVTPKKQSKPVNINLVKDVKNKFMYQSWFDEQKEYERTKAKAKETKTTKEKSLE